MTQRVLTSGPHHQVQIYRRPPLISGWVFRYTGFAAFVLFMADLIAGRP